VALVEVVANGGSEMLVLVSMLTFVW
jgi:hypothetical protein